MPAIEGSQQIGTQQGWRDVLKKIVRQAGVRAKSPVVLLISDVQSAPSHVLEDISLIINRTGIHSTVSVS